MSQATLSPADSASEAANAPQSGEESLERSWVLKALRRRRRPFLVTFGLILLASTATVMIQRLRYPVYEGSFKLLISEPVNDSGQGRATAGEADIAAVARNVRSTDVPTLIDVLESPSVLEPVRQELQRRFPDSEFPTIEVGGENRGGRGAAEGVLPVRARGNEVEVVREALQLTEAAYLRWALQ